MSVSFPGCGDPGDRGEHGPGDPVGGLMGVDEGHEGEQHVLLRILCGTSTGGNLGQIRGEFSQESLKQKKSYNL